VAGIFLFSAGSVRRFAIGLMNDDRHKTVIFRIGPDHELDKIGSSPANMGIDQTIDIFQTQRCE
jgi:hypothetical protein